MAVWEVDIEAEFVEAAQTACMEGMASSSCGIISGRLRSSVYNIPGSYH